jgi:BirA family biotin operon repressor/biotin-[acetyl-CoA-carboxylase] ligase
MAGISRVAVWKGIHSLVESGYPISSGADGYSLREDSEPDYLYPWEFGGDEERFRYFAETGSTMDRAREYALDGFPGGTVISAETQTSGRGRNGRRWVSGRGGLFFSVLERPRLSVVNYTLLAMAAHIALCRALGTICGQDAFLRWPNDVYIDGRKMAGLLTEVYGAGDGIQWMTIGIGVNVNNGVPKDASSCASVLGRPVSRRRILLSILDEFGRVKRAAADPGKLRDLWNYHAEGIGREVVFAEGEKDKIAVLGRGVFLGVDTAGRCMVQSGRGVAGFTPGLGSLVYTRGEFS